MTPAPPDVLAELKEIADILEEGLLRRMYTLPERLRAVAAQIAERERHVAEAVRSAAIKAASTGFAEDAADKIRALDLAAILNPEKSK